VLLSSLHVAQAQPAQEAPDADPGVDHTDLAASVSDDYRRRVVFWRSEHPPGTIVVRTEERFLYLLLPNNLALRYGIGVGRDGFQWGGLQDFPARQPSNGADRADARSSPAVESSQAIRP
jgi:lipoprotein-anchoring transpeptidase ErfK/SrfK